MGRYHNDSLETREKYGTVPYLSLVETMNNINQITSKLFHRWSSISDRINDNYNDNTNNLPDEYYHDASQRKFPQFDRLSDDIIIEILSYITYGPLEYPNGK